MHEASLVEGLIKQVHKAINDFTSQNPNLPLPRVEEIVCETGLLASIEASTMQACFEIFVEGTDLANAKLTIESKPLECECLKCKNQFVLNKRKFICPACESEKIKFENAGGCWIKAIKINNEGIYG